MQTFHELLNNTAEYKKRQTYLIDQTRLYIETNKPFGVSDIQIKFGIGYRRACNLIDYFLHNNVITRNMRGQYIKFNNLKGIN